MAGIPNFTRRDDLAGGTLNFVGLSLEETLEAAKTFASLSEALVILQVRKATGGRTFIDFHLGINPRSGAHRAVLHALANHMKNTTHGEKLVDYAVDAPVYVAH